MKHTLFILFVIQSFSFYGQIYSNCFQKQKIETDQFLANPKQVNVGDTVDDIIEAMETRQKALIGCTYPYSPVSTFDSLEINPTKFKTDYVIINFNTYYCDPCKQQLDWFVKLKKESKKTITVVVFFKDHTKEILELINEYKKELYFVTNAKDYIERYSLGSGQPLNYILNTSKIIKYAKSGTGQTYEELKAVIQ